MWDLHFTCYGPLPESFKYNPIQGKLDFGCLPQNWSKIYKIELIFHPEINYPSIAFILYIQDLDIIVILNSPSFSQ